MFAALAALASAGWLVGLSAADDKKETKAGADKEFFAKASAAGMAEVNLSNVALTRTRNPMIREFAQRTVNAHTMANRELIALANRQAILLPERMDETHQKIFDKLAKLEGDDFDRTYMDGMVKDHEEAVKLFESESKDGKNDAAKEWAGNKLPVLKKHLELARRIAGKDKGGKDKEPVSK
jgi:putative membrane protein